MEKIHQMKSIDDSQKDISLSRVIYLGDSHVQYLKRANFHKLFFPRVFDGCEVGGATAVGMRNPNAMTNSIGKFREYLRKSDRNSIVVIHLGEVDCGYVIWYRAQKYGEPLENQVQESVNAYFNFVDEVIDQGFTKIVITGATMPTITDDDQDGEVVKRRSGINATQRERTDLTLHYNAILREMAGSRNLHYTDITDDVIDSRTSLVHIMFRNSNRLDHHMNYDLAAALWACKLNDIFDELDHRKKNISNWRAKSASFVKSLPWHSKLLPEDFRMKTNVGDILEVRLDADLGEFLLVSHPTLNGSRLNDHLRMIHRAHWTYVADSPQGPRSPDWG